MDEDELAERHAQSLSTHANYDTFGTQATAEAQRAAKAADDSSTVPGLMPQAFIEPVADGIGACMLAVVNTCKPLHEGMSLRPI